jgi:hypothetical protein
MNVEVINKIDEILLRILCTMLFSYTGLCRDARLTEHKTLPASWKVVGLGHKLTGTFLFVAVNTTQSKSVAIFDYHYGVKLYDDF